MASSDEGTAARPHPEVKVLFDYELRNVPGKSIVGVQLDCAPDAYTPPHRHGEAAVACYVLDGEILSATDGGEAKTYAAGESFMIQPGSHHSTAENSSKTTAGKLICVFVLDTDVVASGDYSALSVMD